jgi:hypothetical protein
MEENKNAKQTTKKPKYLRIATDYTWDDSQYATLRIAS